MPADLTSDLSRDDAAPYFLWDAPMTVREIRSILGGPRSAERTRPLARPLPQARDTDVWTFVAPAQVAAEWDEVAPFLGRRRAFWRFLIDRWRAEGFLA
jgi:hypothetical protein